MREEKKKSKSEIRRENEMGRRERE